MKISNIQILAQRLFHSILQMTIWGLLFGISSCHENKKESLTPTIPVAVAHPEVRTVLLTQSYPGYLSADKTIQLIARVSGTLIHRYYQPGQKVKHGQLLFLIDPSTYEQQVQEAQASLNDAEANLNYMKAQYERTAEASKSNAVAEIQVIETQAAFRQASAQVASAEAALALANINLSYCRITAPYNGHVSLNTYSEGNYINAAEVPVLATLYKDDTLYVNFNVSENDLLKRQYALNDNARNAAQGIQNAKGSLTQNKNLSGNKNNMGTEDQTEKNDSLQMLFDRLPLIIPALSDTEHPEGMTLSVKAEMRYISPNIALGTGTLTLQAMIPNRHGLLKDGMYVLVNLPYSQQQNALLIKNNALGHNQMGAFLYLVDDNDSVCLRQVIPGQIIDDTLRIITSGLLPSERYVVNAQLKVRPKMKVSPIEM